LIYKNSIFNNKDKEFKEEYDTETMLIIFKDSSFKDAVVKTNAIQVLKQFGINEVVSV
jgi:adenine-specific DNA-methyltransferase